MLGYLTNDLLAELRASSDAPLAGQTLRDVCVAIRQVKSEVGQWPDLIVDLEVKSSSPEFPSEVFDRIQHHKTESDFVIFAGAPNGFYCDESGQVRYR